CGDDEQDRQRQSGGRDELSGAGRVRGALARGDQRAALAGSDAAGGGAALFFARLPAWDALREAMADIAFIFHWQRAEMLDLPVSELLDWREKARVRWQAAHGGSG